MTSSQHQGDAEDGGRETFSQRRVQDALDDVFYEGHDRLYAAMEERRHHARKYFGHGGAEAIIRQVDALDVNNKLVFVSRLAALDMTARLAWGSADGFQKTEYEERSARALGVPLRGIPGGKHFTPEDHPDIIAEEIMALVGAAYP